MTQRLFYAMLVVAPLAFIANLLNADPVLVFALAAIGLIPLADFIGEATEELAVYTGPHIGGLLNATLGNAAELIITIFAIKEGLLELVRASIIGSILGNLLLVLGMSMLLGGWKYGIQKFDKRNAAMNANLLIMILIALMVPTMMMLIPQFLLARHLLLLDSLAGLVVFYTGGNLGLNTFLLRSFFQDIPVELEEAMIVDGASPWTRFWRLILPLSRPALATAAIFTFLASWDEFTWALTIINDPSRYTLPIAIALFQGQHSTSWGLVFAASAIAIAPVLILFAVFQRQFVAGIASGAVKA